MHRALPKLKRPPPDAPAMKIPINERLVAPCGINCAVCACYLALVHGAWEKDIKIPHCPGCLPRKKMCAYLMKWCALIGKGRIRFCYECTKFPCKRLKALDGRYRARYRTSPVENLGRIRDRGMRSFLASQRRKWRCPRCGGMISCHNGLCFSCDLEVLRKRKKKYSWDDKKIVKCPSGT